MKIGGFCYFITTVLNSSSIKYWPFEFQAEPEQEEDTIEKEEGDEDEEAEEDDTPKPAWKPPPVTPKEDPRTGANKKTYFVCNERKYLN